MPEKIIWLSAAVGLGTVGLRVLPAKFMSGKKLPVLIGRWLSCLPIAVLSALVVPELLLRDGKLDLTAANVYFWVSVPIFFLALKTRSIGLSVITGMIFLAAVRQF